MPSEAPHADDRDPSLGSDDFRRAHPLSELLASAQPLASIEDLRIDELTDDEADAFLSAVGA